MVPFVVPTVTAAEDYLRAFHATRPGITSAALAHAGSYERLAAAVAGAHRVLDLGCADGHLLELLPPGAVGLDMAPSQHPRIVQGRAQELPFRSAAFDAVVCHLAWMLFDELDGVVGELRRVLAPGGTFAAILGAGPTAYGEDAFHRFLELAHWEPLAIGDRRARTPQGWRALFGIEPSFERIELDLGGTFDEVWRFLGNSYRLRTPAAIRTALRCEFPDDRVPCTVVVWLAQIVR